MCRDIGDRSVVGSGCACNTFYDHIRQADTLPRPKADGAWTRERGYAVELSDNDWRFFAALEPAYTYGRAGRMSAQASSWSIREAVSEVQLDPTSGREVRTLHLLFGADHAHRSTESGRRLLADFVAGATATGAGAGTGEAWRISA